MSRLDKLEVGIEFQEGEHTSHEYGTLTGESKRQIIDLVLKLVGEDEEEPSFDDCEYHDWLSPDDNFANGGRFHGPRAANKLRAKLRKKAYKI